MVRWLNADNITRAHLLLISGVFSLAPPDEQSRISAFQHIAGDPKEHENSILPHHHRLMVFGLGNVGSLIAHRSSSLQAANSCKNETFFDEVWGTIRSAKSVPGVQSISFDDSQELKKILPSCTHILVTIPPCEKSNDLGCNINTTLVGGRPRRWKYFCDAVLNHPNFCLQDLVPANTWIGFISSTSVYGNHDGEWVTEDSEEKYAPGTKGELYYRAEEEWRSAASECGWRLHVFRASGLYGNTRSAIHTIRKGKHEASAPNTRPKGISPTSRIHEEDVSRAIISAMMCNEPATGASCIWNLADDDPAEREQVMLFAESLLKEANLLQQRLPEGSKLPSADTRRAKRERRRSTDRKRVHNQRMKGLLPDGVLMYPTYREGLRSVLEYNRKEWSSE